MSASIVPLTMRDFFLDDPFFRSTWEDFDKVRDRVQCRSNNFWNSSQNERNSFNRQSYSSKEDEDTCINKSANQVSSSHVSCENTTNNNLKTPKEWLIPSLRSVFSGDTSSRKSGTEVIRVVDDQNKLEISLDTSQYKPSELSITVKHGMIIIQGKHEDKSESGHTMISREFIRKYSLPHGSKAEDVISNLSTDGILVVRVEKTYSDNKALNSTDLSTKNLLNEEKLMSQSKNTSHDTTLTTRNKEARECISNVLKNTIKSSEAGKIENLDETSTGVKSTELKQETGTTKINVPIRTDLGETNTKEEKHFRSSKNNWSRENGIEHAHETEVSIGKNEIKKDTQGARKLNVPIKTESHKIYKDTTDDVKIDDRRKIDVPIRTNGRDYHENTKKETREKKESSYKASASDAKQDESVLKVKINSNKENILSRSNEEDQFKKVDVIHLKQNTNNCETKTCTNTSNLTNKTINENMESENDVKKLITDGWSFPSLLNRSDCFKIQNDGDIKIEEDENKFELTLDASKYKPDELRVSVANQTITVEGKHEEKSENGHVMVLRQFIRKYSLPAGATAEDVVSNLSSEGILIVTANKSKLLKKRIDVEIKQG